MPNILTIPREIRDEIYKWGMLDTLASCESSPLQRGRKRVAYDAANPETHYGEEGIRYPDHTPLPPTHSLLRTSRQLRAELLDCLRRMGPLTYRIDLTNREDKNTLYPTWISVPILTKRVDFIEVQLRTRRRKTSSISGIVSDNDMEPYGDPFVRGLALLERFLERGVYFLSKKKRQTMSVGLLAINIDKEEQFSDEEIDEWVDGLDGWMMGTRDLDQGLPEDFEREDKQFRFLVGKIEKVSLAFQGKSRREWDLQEMLQKREERRLRPIQADAQL
jgi:hypothetical protein